MLYIMIFFFFMHNSIVVFYHDFIFLYAGGIIAIHVENENQ